jgi:hypothetical protein
MTRRKAGGETLPVSLPRTLRTDVTRTVPRAPARVPSPVIGREWVRLHDARDLRGGRLAAA